MHAEHADRLNGLSGRVIGCAFTVLKTFGAGFAVAQQHAARPDDAHRMQRTNYLKASGLRLCLLPNFSKPRLEIKRVVHDL
jgi:hypothetical protein